METGNVIEIPEKAEIWEKLPDFVKRDATLLAELEDVPIEYYLIDELLASMASTMERHGYNRGRYEAERQSQYDKMRKTQQIGHTDQRGK